MPQSGSSENLPRVLAVLDLLTEEELVHLNHVIVERLRVMQQLRAHSAMVNFRIGQRVKFTATDGRTIRGTLTRYNRKSVTLVTDDGHQWRVSPSILQPE